MFRHIALTAALFFAPTLCVAQDVFGTLTATIDGTERSWFLTSDGEQSQSHALTIAVANTQSFSLWGQPTADTVAEAKDSLLLQFDIMAVGGNTVPLNVTLTYLADGWASGWLANEADQTVFSLSTFKEVDGGLLVEGSFASTAYYSDKLVSGQVDPSQTKQINGRFSATLPEALLKVQ
ncbi:hypothetical protein [Thioclava indica]|uniref:Lipid/polyisoprenoid-binding YceI-like domain-containing protein n=1 Tax=Thioclava indica TaxID=1353528 RepID=A0A074JXU7_9RHOB|nr:hypothetical protein [Thioclava indica]KEO60695.1 hypothetical protein DT23_12700 [Thioclava indica]